MESGAIKKLYRKTIYFILTVINSTEMTQYPYHQYNMGTLTGIMFTVHTDNTTLYLEKSECLCVGLASLIDEWSLSQLEGGILRSVFDCSSWKMDRKLNLKQITRSICLEGRQTNTSVATAKEAWESLSFPPNNEPRPHPQHLIKSY